MKIPFLLLLMSVAVLPVIGRQVVRPNPLIEKVTLAAIQDRLKRKKSASESKRSFFSTDPDAKLIILSDSKRTRLFIERAQVYKKAGIKEGFLRDIGRAIQVSDNDSSVLATITTLITQVGDENGCQYAIVLNTTHLKRYPSSDTAFGSRAKAKTCLGDHLGAFDDISKALEIKPDDRYYMLDRANIPNRVTDTTKALELFQIVIDDNKKLLAKVQNANLAITYKSLLASSYVGRSFIYRKIGDKDKQLADLTIAVEIYPDPNLRTRASVYHQYKMFDDAISDITKSIRLQEQRYGPRNQRGVWSDYVYRAYLYTDAGKIVEAIADYQKAIELSPENKEILEKRIAQIKQNQ